MKTRTHAPPILSRLIYPLLIVLALAIALPSQVLAGTAGGTSITNIATVTYTDSLGNPGQTSQGTVTVTVNTVDAAPGVVYLEPAGTTNGPGDTYVYNAAVFNKANGPGSINNIAATDGSESNITLSVTTPSDTFTDPITLGATSIEPGDGDIGSTPNIADGGSITFDVPSDGTADDVINGLEDGDKAYIWDGTTEYGPFDVDVDEPAGTITLTNNTGSSITIGTAIAAGWQIGEATIATVTVTQGTNITADPATWVTTLSAEMNSLSGSDTITTTATESDLQVFKYIRNVTDSGSNSGTADETAWDTDGGGADDFYNTDGDVTADPGDTLEYLIVVDNNGAAAATAAILTDSVPAYTSITLTSFAVDTNGNGDFVDAADIVTGDENFSTRDGGVVYINGNNITVYLGTGASDNPGTGGSLAGGSTVAVKFQVVLQ